MEWQDWTGGFSQKEKDPQGHCGELSWSSSSSLLSTWLPSAPAGLWGISSPNPKHWGESAHHTKTTGTNWGECNSERHQTKDTGESANQGRPRACTPIAWSRVSAWTCGSGPWRAGPQAAQVLVRTEKSWARLPELATAKKDQQNWLGQ